MQFFDVGIAIETEDTDFTVGDTVLFMNPCNISGMIHWFHTVTRYADSKIRLLGCKVPNIVTFFYTVFNIISSTGRSWLYCDWLIILKRNNIGSMWKIFSGFPQKIGKFNNFSFSVFIQIFHNMVKWILA